jgi:hypothetical protein
MIPQVKKTDVEVLGWLRYTWSAVERAVGCTAKFFKTAAYGREIQIKLSGSSFVGHSYSQHANCTTQCGIVCVTKLHILEWYFIVPRTRCTCVMTMPFNQLLDMPYRLGGWIILAEEKFSVTGMREISLFFLHMEHFWDLLFHLMKHGTNT